VCVFLFCAWVQTHVPHANRTSLIDVHKNTAPKNYCQYKIGFKTFLLIHANSYNILIINPLLGFCRLSSYIVTVILRRTYTRRCWQWLSQGCLENSWFIHLNFLPSFCVSCNIFGYINLWQSVKKFLCSLRIKILTWHHWPNPIYLNQESLYHPL
jgi:hypothetical protein